MKKANKKLITVILALIFVIIALYTKNESIVSYVEETFDIDLKIDYENNSGENVEEKPLTIECKVLRVVDGDTIVVNYNGNEEKVRLIGIDTPESVHPNENKNTEDGVKISNYTKERLTEKVVELEFDVQQRDKYGRLLAYVYLDGEMYNKELLEKGYAKISTYPPNVRYVDEFTEIQKDARKNKVGLWK